MTDTLSKLISDFTIDDDDDDSSLLNEHFIGQSFVDRMAGKTDKDGGSKQYTSKSSNGNNLIKDASDDSEEDFDDSYMNNMNKNKDSGYSYVDKSVMYLRGESMPKKDMKTKSTSTTSKNSSSKIGVLYNNTNKYKQGYYNDAYNLSDTDGTDDDLLNISSNYISSQLFFNSNSNNDFSSSSSSSKIGYRYNDTDDSDDSYYSDGGDTDDDDGDISSMIGDYSGVDKTKEAGLGISTKMLTKHLLSGNGNYSDKSQTLIKSYFVQVASDPSYNKGWGLIGSTLYNGLLSNDTKQGIDSICNNFRYINKNATDVSQEEKNLFIKEIGDTLTKYTNALKSKDEKQAYHYSYELANLLHSAYSNDSDKFDARVAEHMNDTDISGYIPVLPIGLDFRGMIKGTKRKIKNTYRIARGKSKLAPEIFKWEKVKLTDRLFDSPGSVQKIFDDDKFFGISKWVGADKQTKNFYYNDSIQFGSLADLEFDMRPLNPNQRLGAGSEFDGLYINTQSGADNGNTDGLMTDEQAWPQLYFGKRRGRQFERKSPLGTQYSWLLTTDTNYNDDQFDTVDRQSLELFIQMNIFSTCVDSKSKFYAWKRRFVGKITLTGSTPGKLSRATSKYFSRRRANKAEKYYPGTTLRKSFDGKSGPRYEFSTKKIREMISSGVMSLYRLVDFDSNSFAYVGIYQEKLDDGNFRFRLGYVQVFFSNKQAASRQLN